MRIAVAGGTGWSGRLIVRELSAAGHEATVIARRTGADLLTGEGVQERLVGVDAVVDVTNVNTLRAKKSTDFFAAATTNLLSAEEAAGVRHHLMLSIVGCDKVDLGYYRGKRRQEQLVTASSVPHTIVRVTQFHEFAAQRLADRGPFVFAPKMRCQPVALEEVARHLARLATGEPLGRAPELAGPEPDLMMDEMIVRLAKKQGDRRIRLRMGMPGTVGRQIDDGGLLPTSAGPRGRITFDEWLAGAPV